MLYKKKVPMPELNLGRCVYVYGYQGAPTVLWFEEIQHVSVICLKFFLHLEICNSVEMYNDSNNTM